jgi:hypothetical protein
MAPGTIKPYTPPPVPEGRINLTDPCSISRWFDMQVIGSHAKIRPYQCPPYDPPRAAGIPTGDGEGYPALTDHVRAIIDEAMGIIKNRLATGHCTRVIYGAASAPGDLGTGISDPAPDVKRCIVSELRGLAE